MAKTARKSSSKVAVQSTTKTAAKATTKLAKKSKPKIAPSAATNANSSDILGLSHRTWISTCRLAKGNEARAGSRGFVICLDSFDVKKTRSSLHQHLSRWQMDLLLKSEQELMVFQGSQGPVCVLRLLPPQREKYDIEDSTLSKSPYARARDFMSSVLTQLLSFKIDKLIVEFTHLTHPQRQGILIGLELASYSYSENRDNPRKPRKKRPTLLLRPSDDELSSQEIKSCSQIALATNIARHLVNLPAGDLTPRTYSDLVERLFDKSKSVTVTIWEGKKLQAERMNLLNAVGAAAVDGPRLVQISYRPKNARTGQKPIAFVGKGITFDTGGLDLKPSSGMRLMKKDMGGSAACLAIAKWAEQSELELPLDIYLSLAENSVGSPSFRPGDIITSRNGLTIEIHNTDAEGRLVLADALDVAINASEKPAAVIDLATLTGAIKVGLGGEIAGLFCNDDKLANAILDAGSYRGDLAWRMPLFQPYKTMLRSSFADYANASDGFAGAITAALFLELFVGQIPWAHLDIYSWKDGAGGAYSESGGNGQPVQMLTELLTRFAESADGFRETHERERN
jgi:leucyl aminopeptidase